MASKIAGLILVLHLLLSLDATRKLSPAWDEICYAAAGTVQMKTRTVWQETFHPPLSALFYSVPLLFLDVQLPSSDVRQLEKNAFRFGYDFVFRNKAPAKKIVFWSRVPAVIFSVLTGLVLFFWMRSVAGPIGALFALFGYCLSPLILSRSCMALLEMPMLFFTTLALWLHYEWFKNGKKIFLTLSGISLGFALACKLVALPLLAGLFVLSLVGRLSSLKPTSRFFSACFHATVAVLVFGMVLVIPWTNGGESFRQVKEGVLIFNKAPYYWNGRFVENAPSVLSLVAFFVKAPLGLFLISIGGWITWIRSDASRSAMRYFIALIVSSGVSVLFLKSAVSTVQLIPVTLGLAGMAGGWGFVWHRMNRVRKGTLACLIVLAIVEVIFVHPNYLSFFNPLAGGPSKGSRWLAGSDHDWGQSLPALARYLKKSGDPNVILSYSGSAEPEAYGIFYQDLFSPALTSRVHKDVPLDPKKPTVLAVGSNMIQTYPDVFEEFMKDRRPQAEISYNFLVWSITSDVNAYKWLGKIYMETGRHQQAHQAFTLASHE